MRSTRIVSAFVALVLAISLAGLVVSPAQAAKPRHDLTYETGRTASGILFIKGKVSTYRNKKITIQRKVNKNASYVTYKRPETNDRGKFRVNVNGPIGACFKIVVPSTKTYRTTKKVVGCIVPA